MHTLAILAQLATSAALAPSALAALYSNVATDAVVTALLRRWRHGCYDVSMTDIVDVTYDLNSSR